MNADRIEVLRKIAEQEPEDLVAQYGLGRTLLGEGRAEEALSPLRRAIAIDPNHSAAWRELGRALLDAGKPGESLAVLQRGIDVARKRGDLQTVREMEVFAKRADRAMKQREGVSA